MRGSGKQFAAERYSTGFNTVPSFRETCFPCHKTENFIITTINLSSRPPLPSARTQMYLQTRNQSRPFNPSPALCRGCQRKSNDSSCFLLVSLENIISISRMMIVCPPIRLLYFLFRAHKLVRSPLLFSIMKSVPPLIVIG